MCSLKDDVKQITIVEENKGVIKLFEQKILPQFLNKDKIKIIHANPFNFLEELKDGKYDYCFVALWRSFLKLINYIKAKYQVIN